MRVKKVAVIAAVLLLLCSCQENLDGTTDTLPQTDAYETLPTSTDVPVETEIIDETTAREILSDESVQERTDTSQGESDFQTDATEETEETSASEITTSVTAETTETEAATETPTVSETTAPKVTEATTSATSPVKVVIPTISTGNFTGEKVLENDIACVDISDAKNGVIMVSYKGICDNVKVRITYSDTIYDYCLYNGSEVYPLQSGGGEYNIKVLENVSGKTYAIVFDESFTVSDISEFSPYLLPTQYINYSQNDECVKKAAELCAGCEGNAEKIAAIFAYVTDNITYDKQLAASVKSGYVPDPDLTLEKGTGICFDYASLFAAMCRSQSIPARLVMGYVQGDIYHAWNEVYTEETGWVTLDLFIEKNKWNLLDPTFYASAENKSDAAEYMSDTDGYIAVYYY